MKYIDFISTFREPIFTIQDLKIANIRVSTVQLSQWTKNGYLIKLKNGVYAFSERKDSLIMEVVFSFSFWAKLCELGARPIKIWFNPGDCL